MSHLEPLLLLPFFLLLPLPFRHVNGVGVDDRSHVVAKNKKKSKEGFLKK
jgi:hypothetical protein